MLVVLRFYGTSRCFERFYVASVSLCVRWDRDERDRYSDRDGRLESDRREPREYRDEEDGGSGRQRRDDSRGSARSGWDRPREDREPHSEALSPPKMAPASSFSSSGADTVPASSNADWDAPVRSISSSTSSSDSSANVVAPSWDAPIVHMAAASSWEIGASSPSINLSYSSSVSSVPSSASVLQSALSGHDATATSASLPSSNDSSSTYAAEPPLFHLRLFRTLLPP